MVVRFYAVSELIESFRFDETGIVIATNFRCIPTECKISRRFFVIMPNNQTQGNKSGQTGSQSDKWSTGQGSQSGKQSSSQSGMNDPHKKQPGKGNPSSGQFGSQQKEGDRDYE
jgi:hypothetical protein